MFEQPGMPQPWEVKPLNLVKPLKIQHPHISRTDMSKITAEIHDNVDRKNRSNSRVTTDVGEDGEVGESYFE